MIRNWFGAETRRPDRILLLVFAIVAALALIVFKLASEVSEGDTRALDTAVLLGLRGFAEHAGPVAHAMRLAMLDVTAFGDTTTLVLVIVAVSGFLFTARKARIALYLLIAPVLGMITVEWLKSAFDRPRPTVVAHWANYANTSFPSGHAADSAIVYLTIAALLARSVSSRSLRFYVVAVATTLTFLIGFSRLYLGVHWPTDVLAGWILGAGWALMSSSVAWWLQARRRLNTQCTACEPPLEIGQDGGIAFTKLR